MSEPVERREFSESYVSLRVGSLYLWFQVDRPDVLRIEVGRRELSGATVNQDEFLQLAAALVVEARSEAC